MARFGTDLDTLVTHLERRGQSVGRGAGASDFPIAVTPTLRALYDRCGAGDRLELLPGLRLLSPLQTATEYERCRQSQGWDECWLPLLTADSVVVVAVECCGELDDVWVEQGHGWIRERVSLAEWVAGVVACYEAGVLDDDPAAFVF